MARFTFCPLPAAAPGTLRRRVRNWRGVGRFRHRLRPFSVSLGEHTHEHTPILRPQPTAYTTTVNT